MKVTIKGQVTIPLALRERFGLKAGTEVEFIAKDSILQLCRVLKSPEDPSPFQCWLARAAGSANQGLTSDQLMAMTRGED